MTRTDTNHKETGTTGGTFKSRDYKHQSDFRNPAYEHCTTLSQYIWQLKKKKKILYKPNLAFICFVSSFCPNDMLFQFLAIKYEKQHICHSNTFKNHIVIVL